LGLAGISPGNQSSRGTAVSDAPEKPVTDIAKTDAANMNPELRRRMRRMY
jgi:hypothetical protein